MIRAALAAVLMAGTACADGLRPGARLETGWLGGLSVTLPLESPVPWRAFVVAEPWRLVVDAEGVDWAALDAEAGGAVTAIGTEPVPAGWSRLSLALAGPMRLHRAWMETGAAPAIRLDLTEGAGATGPRGPDPWDAADRPEPLAVTTGRAAAGPLTVALDPGHGGVDPGAMHDGLTEAALMLTFARELEQALSRAGHRVVLTRGADAFVGLRSRSSLARAAGADLMISLHADAVEGGGASGATVYTLSDRASDAMSGELAARQGRDDLIEGVALDDAGDVVAGILVDLARRETAPRGAMLADALVAGLRDADIRLHKRPRLEAGFTVLKAPDIPSVLLELGFLSSEADRRNLADPAWRARMADAVAAAVGAWAEADRAARSARRR